MKKNRAYIISEIWWNELRFNIKMLLHIFIVLALMHAIVFYLTGIIFFGEKMALARQYTIAALARAFTLNPSFNVTISGREFTGIHASDLVKSSEIRKVLASQIPGMLLTFVASSGVYLLFIPALRLLKKRARLLEEREFISGSRLVDEDELNTMIRNDGFEQRIQVAGIGLPIEAETRHGLCVATSGAGKTQLMLPMLQAIRHMGAKAIIHVPKGDYLAKFYDPKTDFILNPLDQRCIGWSVFNEIRSVPDIQTVAASLIPPSIGGTMDPFWNNAARDVFTGILHKLYSTDKKTNLDIWQAVTSKASDVVEMLESVKGGEAGYTYIQDASGKQALGVLATMMQFTRAFEFMADADGPFNISEWLRNGKPGFIFVTNYEDIKDTLKPVLSLFIDLFGKRLLSLDEDRERRIFVMLDEFGSLQRLSTLVNLQLRARSFGGGIWIFVQDNGQIVKLYGRETAQSIINSANTHIILSVPDAETSRYWSERFGKSEFWEYELTASFGVEDVKDGGSIRKVRKVEDLLKASDLSNLPDLTGYVRIPRPLKHDGTPHAAGYPYARIRIPLTRIDDIAPAFLMKDTWNLDQIFKVKIEDEKLESFLRKSRRDNPAQEGDNRDLKRESDAPYVDKGYQMDLADL